jgi:hypothetical protein
MPLNLRPNRDELIFRTRVTRLTEVFRSLDRDILGDNESFPWDPHGLLEGNYEAAARMYLNEEELGKYFSTLSEESRLVVLKNPTSKFGWPVYRRVSHDPRTKTNLELSVLLNGKNDKHQFKINFGGSGMPIDKIVQLATHNNNNNQRYGPKINEEWTYSFDDKELKPTHSNTNNQKPTIANTMEFVSEEYHSQGIEAAAESALIFLRAYRRHLDNK